MLKKKFKTFGASSSAFPAKAFNENRAVAPFREHFMTETFHFYIIAILKVT
jgi:hypothetical protein